MNTRGFVRVSSLPASLTVQSELCLLSDQGWHQFSDKHELCSELLGSTLLVPYENLIPGDLRQ